MTSCIPADPFRRGALFGLALALMTVTTSAPAQQKRPLIDVSAPAPEPVVERSYHVHDGFYLRSNIGIGALGFKYNPGPLDSSADGGGLAFDLLVGGSPSRGVAIGGAWLNDIGRSLTLESEGRELGDLHALSSLLGPFIDGFPDPKGGWHAGGMVGFANQRFDEPGSDKTYTTRGIGGAAWGGFDAWVGDEWAVGGLGRVAAAVTKGSEDGVDVDASSLSFMLMFTALHH